MDAQIELAVIGLLVAVVGAVQAVLVSYFGRAAKNAAGEAATLASTAAAQTLTNSSKLDEVKQIVNGQLSAAHQRADELQGKLDQKEDS